MATDPAWLKTTADGIEIALYVQPGAKKSEFAGEHDGALKLRINAPPVEGRANAAVIAFIAASCGVARSRVTLIGGELHRHKRVRVDDVGARERLLDRVT
ncbi:MAG: DUF167 family protein [Burkholderiales bacterium]|nr:DUF167 family protein [Burkholderiales bacterium]